MSSYGSWGRYPRADPLEIISLTPGQELPQRGRPFLPYGQGRSYGDVCLNNHNILLNTANLNEIQFDEKRGRIRSGSGLTLKEVLRVTVPAGWFLPVTPGTQFVTIGGAIANDVHGKNHHRVGTFGTHVAQFELMRSNGERFVCSPQKNSGYYRATIGGLGLTGLITWADIQLKKISSPWIEMESIPFANLDEFLQLSHGSEREYEYTVSWIDTTSVGSNGPRGIFIRGNHAAEEKSDGPVPAERSLSVPFDMPFSLFNPLTIRLFNEFYYHMQRKSAGKRRAYYRPFFYPLDAFLHWNRLYGRRGFFQYQCVVPFEHARATINELLRRSRDSRAVSGLSVVKTFGAVPSPGMLSFPMPGVTLALDFYYRNDALLTLFDTFDRLVLEAGGRVYPAKDARMGAGTFQRQFPEFERFKEFVDPNFSSDFWRRVSRIVESAQ